MTITIPLSSLKKSRFSGRSTTTLKEDPWPPLMRAGHKIASCLTIVLLVVVFMVGELLADGAAELRGVYQRWKRMTFRMY